MTEQPPLKAKDLRTDQEVRWCPGCGDYAILASVQKAVAATGTPRHKHVFISGIGCAARLPFYMETYGFHTIHGRAPAIATGLAVANPDLTVWVATGDGDSLSIGGNHFILEKAVAHQGTSIVEVLQNCVIFNDAAFGHITDKKTAKYSQLRLEEGSPLLFSDGEKAIAMRGADPVVAQADDDDVLTHRYDAGPSYGGMLASLDAPDFPRPLGVLWQHQRPSYEQAVLDQVEAAKSRRKDAGDLRALLCSGQTWQVD
jgi:pyruvate/2-oxoacid:ferredoxin oxidoreductase beta subunit